MDRNNAVQKFPENREYVSSRNIVPRVSLIEKWKILLDHSWYHIQYSNQPGNSISTLKYYYYFREKCCHLKHDQVHI